MVFAHVTEDEARTQAQAVEKAALRVREPAALLADVLALPDIERGEALRDLAETDPNARIEYAMHLHEHGEMLQARNVLAALLGEVRSLPKNVGFSARLFRRGLHFTQQSNKHDVLLGQSMLAEAAECGDLAAADFLATSYASGRELGDKTQMRVDKRMQARYLSLVLSHPDVGIYQRQFAECALNKIAHTFRAA